jgi:hypothetical protein
MRLSVASVIALTLYIPPQLALDLECFDLERLPNHFLDRRRLLFEQVHLADGLGLATTVPATAGLTACS